MIIPYYIYSLYYTHIPHALNILYTVIIVDVYILILPVIIGVYYIWIYNRYYSIIGYTSTSIIYVSYTVNAAVPAQQQPTITLHKHINTNLYHVYILLHIQ